MAENRTGNAKIGRTQSTSGAEGIPALESFVAGCALALGALGLLAAGVGAGGVGAPHLRGWVAVFGLVALALVARAYRAGWGAALGLGLVVTLVAVGFSLPDPAGPPAREAATVAGMFAVLAAFALLAPLEESAQEQGAAEGVLGKDGGRRGGASG